MQGRERFHNFQLTSSEVLCILPNEPGAGGRGGAAAGAGAGGRGPAQRIVENIWDPLKNQGQQDLIPQQVQQCVSSESVKNIEGA